MGLVTTKQIHLSTTGLPIILARKLEQGKKEKRKKIMSTNRG